MAFRGAPPNYMPRHTSSARGSHAQKDYHSLVYGELPINMPHLYSSANLQPSPLAPPTIQPGSIMNIRSVAPPESSPSQSMMDMQPGSHSTASFGYMPQSGGQMLSSNTQASMGFLPPPFPVRDYAFNNPRAFNLAPPPDSALRSPYAPYFGSQDPSTRIMPYSANISVESNFGLPRQTPAMRNSGNKIEQQMPRLSAAPHLIAPQKPMVISPRTTPLYPTSVEGDHHIGYLTNTTNSIHSPRAQGDPHLVSQNGLMSPPTQNLFSISPSTNMVSQTDNTLNLLQNETVTSNPARVINITPPQDTGTQNIITVTPSHSSVLNELQTRTITHISDVVSLATLSSVSGDACSPANNAQSRSSSTIVDITPVSPVSTAPISASVIHSPPEQNSVISLVDSESPIPVPCQETNNIGGESQDVQHVSQSIVVSSEELLSVSVTSTTPSSNSVIQTQNSSTTSEPLPILHQPSASVSRDSVHVPQSSDPESHNTVQVSQESVPSSTSPVVSPTSQTTTHSSVLTMRHNPHVGSPNLIHPEGRKEDSVSPTSNLSVTIPDNAESYTTAISVCVSPTLSTASSTSKSSPASSGTRRSPRSTSAVKNSNKVAPMNSTWILKTHFELTEEDKDDYCIDGERYSCVKCNYSTPREDKIAQHLQAHKGDLICQVCGKAFIKVCDLERHNNAHAHGRTRQPFPIQGKGIQKKGEKVTVLKQKEDLDLSLYNIPGLDADPKEFMDDEEETSENATTEQGYSEENSEAANSSAVITTRRQSTDSQTEKPAEGDTTPVSKPNPSSLGSEGSREETAMETDGAQQATTGPREAGAMSEGSDVQLMQLGYSQSEGGAEDAQPTRQSETQAATQNTEATRGEPSQSSPQRETSGTETEATNGVLLNQSRPGPREESTMIQPHVTDMRTEGQLSTAATVSDTDSARSAVQTESVAAIPSETPGGKDRNCAEQIRRNELLIKKERLENEVGQYGNQMDTEPTQEGPRELVIQDEPLEEPQYNQGILDERGLVDYQTASGASSLYALSNGSHPNPALTSILTSPPDGTGDFSNGIPLYKQLSVAVNRDTNTEAVSAGMHSEYMSPLRHRDEGDSLAATMGSPPSNVQPGSRANRLFYCGLCTYSTNDTLHMERHLRAHRTDSKKCKFCDKAFEKPSDRVRHEARHVAGGRGVTRVPRTSWGTDKTLASTQQTWYAPSSQGNSVPQNYSGLPMDSVNSDMSLPGMPEPHMLPTVNDLQGHAIRPGLPAEPSIPAISNTFPNTPQNMAARSNSVEKMSFGAAGYTMPVTNNTGITPHSSNNTPSESILQPSGVTAKTSTLPDSNAVSVEIGRVDEYNKNILVSTSLMNMKLNGSNMISVEVGQKVDLMNENALPAPNVSSIVELQYILKQMPPGTRIHMKKGKGNHPGQGTRTFTSSGGEVGPGAQVNFMKQLGMARSVSEGNDIVGTSFQGQGQTDGVEGQDSPMGIVNGSSNLIERPAEMNAEHWVDRWVATLFPSLNQEEMKAMNQASFEYHRLKSTGPIRKSSYYRCDKCNYVTNNGTKMEEHNLAHRLGKYICRICNKAFLKNSDVTRHMPMHMSIPGAKKKYKCDLCMYDTTRADLLEQHLHYHRKNRKCPICDRIVNKPVELKRHLLVHARKGECVNLIQAVSTKESDTTSQMQVKLESLDTSIPDNISDDTDQNTSGEINQNDDSQGQGATVGSCYCPECGQGFMNTFDLGQHRQHAHNIHSKSQPHEFACSGCGRGFVTYYQLKKHRQLQCQGKIGLTRQRRLQNGAQCRYCKKRFTTIYYMRHHERLHTGEKPYRCDSCGMRFALKPTLLVHQRHRCRIGGTRKRNHFQVSAPQDPAQNNTVASSSGEFVQGVVVYRNLQDLQ